MLKKSAITKRAMVMLALLFTGLLASSVAFSGSGAKVGGEVFDPAEYITYLTDILSAVLFFNIPVVNMPFLVLWLLVGASFFTLRLGFVNIRLFGHALAVVRGKYSCPDDPGQVSHFQALTAAVSATVGLGNIAGVAVAITVGGPGAVVWMVMMGMLGMSSKFAEVTMGQKYRKIDENGVVSGGAFHYLEDGLKEKGLAKLGKGLALVFAVCCLGGAIGGGNMFQSNQAVSIISDTFLMDESEPIVSKWMIALFFSISVGVVIIGGIRRIAHVAEKIVPTMAFIYLAGATVILFMNVDKLGGAFEIMIKSAFGLDAVAGGLLGAIIQGVKRAAFSSEAGLGSAPIAHAAARTKMPVREGCVGLLEPFIDTVVICFMTGMVIVVTGVYQVPFARNLEIREINTVLEGNGAFGKTLVDYVDEQKFEKLLLVDVGDKVKNMQVLKGEFSEFEYRIVEAKGRQRIFFKAGGSEKWRPVFEIKGGTTGVLLTSRAFATVMDWFPIVLCIAVVLFAYSTMITWSYYGERAWNYLFGPKYVVVFNVFFISMTFVGGITSLNVVINFSDLLLLSMAIPNLMGLYILSGDLRKDTKEYIASLKAGEFPRYKHGEIEGSDRK